MYSHRCLFTLLAGVAATIYPLCAQDVLRGSGPGGEPILFSSDRAVLESGEARTDLACTVTPDRTYLGFDLKFHAGYSVTIPVKDLLGLGNNLSILFRLTPAAPARTVYFFQRVRVPPLTDSSGDVKLNGGFDLGAGSYRVDWLMRDSGGRYCSSYWDVDAALAPKDSQMAVALPPGTITRREDEDFQPEAPVQRDQQDVPLNVKVLMNFAPEQPESVSVDSRDRVALVSIVRNLSRNPRVGKISLVAFNIQQQRVFYRQDFADQVDFPAVGRALKNLNLGTVNLGQLQNKNGDIKFLSGLIRNETATGQAPDGLVFVGPKSLLDSSVPQDDLKQIGDLSYPVFYMDYNPDPLAVPWKDAIGRMVKFFKGREYIISGPRDLWNAVTEAVARMAKAKEARGAGVSGGNPPR